MKRCTLLVAALLVTGCGSHHRTVAPPERTLVCHVSKNRASITFRYSLSTEASAQPHGNYAIVGDTVALYCPSGTSRTPLPTVGYTSSQGVGRVTAERDGKIVARCAR